ncbi:MAG: HAMP domain-containing histidine kinase, partial [Chloroflexota bacterium]
DELEESRHHLLANLVHELGRPLGAMRSGIHAIQRGAGQDHDMLMELANGMDEESNRMQHVLEELTHLHDQVIGTLELNKEEIILAEWLPNILLPWRQVAQENQLDWEEDIASDLPKINLDPIRMAQVIGNLASNAVRYTPAGGSIKFSAVSSDKQVMFNFEDTGPGIIPDEQDLVFEPFYRGDQGKRIKQGMGLGLSIARDITHAHGGEIELWSEPGEGSKFTVWLPLI